MWDARDARWEEGFDALVRFVEREGHARVPASHMEGDLKLGRWVVNQRVFRREGWLSDERARRLENQSDWVWDPFDVAWEENFAALLRFVEREGQARMVHSNVQDGLNLGRWVIKQRAAHHKGRLSDERSSRLESLPGWVWQAAAG